MHESYIYLGVCMSLTFYLIIQPWLIYHFHLFLICFPRPIIHLSDLILENKDLQLPLSPYPSCYHNILDPFLFSLSLPCHLLSLCLLSFCFLTLSPSLFSLFPHLLSHSLFRTPHPFLSQPPLPLPLSIY